MSVGTCVFFGTRVAALPRCVTQRGHGWVRGCLLASLLWAHVWIVPAWRAWALGHPVLSPLGRALGTRHAPGRVGGRVGGAPAVGGFVGAGALLGAKRGGLRGVRRATAPGARGRAGGHTWAPGVCHRGHVRLAGGNRGRGGGAPALPGEGDTRQPRGWRHEAVPGVPHAGHLLRTGRIFRSRGRSAGGAARRVKNPSLF